MMWCAMLCYLNTRCIPVVSYGVIWYTSILTGIIDCYAIILYAMTWYDIYIINHRIILFAMVCYGTACFFVWCRYSTVLLRFMSYSDTIWYDICDIIWWDMIWYAGYHILGHCWYDMCYDWYAMCDMRRLIWCGIIDIINIFYFMNLLFYDEIHRRTGGDHRLGPNTIENRLLVVPLVSCRFVLFRSVGGSQCFVIVSFLSLIFVSRFVFI